jgi:epoxide hydrolase
VEQLKQAAMDGMGYLQLQRTRPQTLAYALTDSPVGQLAWIVEKFKEWSDTEAPLPEQAVDRDQRLANVSLDWFTRSERQRHATYESMHAQDWSEQGPAPVGWAVFGADGLVRRLVDPEHKIAHWSEFDHGGTSRLWKHRNC